ncbi:uncharacterized protein LOC128229882 isoform X1 [Mya arenaria]|uniref:uncharacterized protein LOC128229882 isoform X1 n=1 Tax=Mya arenaria TaxID=6604 RepID=UPI0022E80230|nr:uncharacterized protein LOC128229882 isoform X1 [Mya arenaria]
MTYIVKSVRYIAYLMLLALSSQTSVCDAGITKTCPRSATFLVYLLDDSEYMRAPVGYQSEETPFSEYLWQQTTLYQQQSLKSHFVQEISKASLNPVDFGAYIIQDNSYVFNAAESVAIAASNATDANLKAFLEARYVSYKKYYEEAFRTWHIGDASGVKLGKECADYVNHERNVALTMPSIYTIVSMIPCAKLWPWIGKQIKADTGNFGVYTEWVRENFDPNNHGSDKYETMINNAAAQGHIDKSQALKVYMNSMMGEVEFFNSISLY